MKSFNYYWQLLKYRLGFSLWHPEDIQEQTQLDYWSRTTNK